MPFLPLHPGLSSTIIFPPPSTTFCTTPKADTHTPLLATHLTYFTNIPNLLVCESQQTPATKHISGPDLRPCQQRSRLNQGLLQQRTLFEKACHCEINFTPAQDIVRISLLWSVVPRSPRSPRSQVASLRRFHSWNSFITPP